MISDAVVLAAERLRDDLDAVKSDIRRRYRAPTSQVRAAEVKKVIARLAETWLVELAGNPAVLRSLDSRYVADLNVHFQRLLTHSEAATQRKVYEAEIKAILKDYSLKLIIPLKQLRGTEPEVAPQYTEGRHQEEVVSLQVLAFVGQSFAEVDKGVNEHFKEVLEAIGVSVVTGERPKAEKISEKVKGRIDLCSVFVGVFTRRDKIAGRKKWTTSTWVIEEKAYAVGKSKKLILLREDGVDSIGGLQGDYEYVEFSRDGLGIATIRLLQMFDVRTMGLL